MGVLEFFGTLVRHNVTNSSIQTGFTKKTKINHFLVDFNSIIHVSGKNVLSCINALLKTALKLHYRRRLSGNTIITPQLEKYKMAHILKKIKSDSDPELIVDLFHEHFTPKLLDKLVITDVVKTVLYMLRTYCQNDDIKTLLLSIDGVPSKGKMVEQRQRRYLGAITIEYEKLIMLKYSKFLKQQEDNVYLATKKPIHWSRNKITPGTAFMHKLVAYLRSDNIQTAFKKQRPNLNVVLTDMYEIGEGETKIVNYVHTYLDKTKDSVVVYSPDADMILLCMLLPVQDIHMLRFNQQTSDYDMINIKLLKDNIGNYINNNPTAEPEKFDVDKINRDIVCLSTLFGNDFVPRIETLNVKKGFQNIMDAYLTTLLEFKTKGHYLIKTVKDSQTKGGRSRSKSKKMRGGTEPSYRLNLTFLRSFLEKLVPEEEDFIEHNSLYNQYITFGQIKYVFSHMEINEENVVSTVTQFKQEYGTLTNLIRQNGDYMLYTGNELFMNSLKRAVNLTIDDKQINTIYLTNKEFLGMLKSYYNKVRDFPRLNINLNTYTRDIDSPLFKRRLKDDGVDPTNIYQRDLYKFRNMLNEYYVKFNAQPLTLDVASIDDYYKTYFGKKVLTAKGELTGDGVKIMQDYVEGIVWVFNYYYNERTYINTWYYSHERAPLLGHILMYLKSIDLATFTNMFDNLAQYQVKDLTKYFNPVEQLISVSPMTKDIVQLLPANYQSYIMSKELDPFLASYFVDVKAVTKKIWKEKVATTVDCRSIPYFNKCLMSYIIRPTREDDKQFLEAIRKVEPTDVSKRRSKNAMTPF